MKLKYDYPMEKHFQGDLFWDTMNIVETGENLWYGMNC
jgi:hypothetical protein